MKYTVEEIEAAARAAHEVNRVYCREVMNDNGHMAWKDVPDWVRDSAIAGVRVIAECHQTTPRQSHEGWLRVKRAEGWVYGQKKDSGRKTHPCMVEYDQLPLGQRVKNTLFGAVVRAVLGIDDHEPVTVKKSGQVGQ